MAAAKRVSVKKQETGGEGKNLYIVSRDDSIDVYHVFSEAVKIEDGFAIFFDQDRKSVV